MSSAAKLVEVEGGPWPVECFLYVDFYDGPLDGFLRCGGLGRALNGSTEFVCGPAVDNWPAFYGWHWRAFLAVPAPEGTCERLRGSPAMRQGGPSVPVQQLDHDSRSLPPDLQLLYATVEERGEGERRGCLVIVFEENFTGLRAWRAGDGGTLTRDHLTEYLPAELSLKK